MKPVYAFHASEEFNQWLHEVLERISDDVQAVMSDNLVSLLLGGGYGRGEGGVVVIGGREWPYNDIDFTLVVKNKFKLPWNALSKISKKYENETRIHVDFSRPLTLNDIKNWPRWLVWYDLLNGYSVLAGPGNILEDNAPRYLRENLPAIEAGKLLLNRGAGILWAMRMSRQFELAGDIDFIRRNYYKCALALGDALMIAYQCYKSPYRGRLESYVAMKNKFPEVKKFPLETLYKAALDFKFCPDSVKETEPSLEDLKYMAQLWGSVFLHIEQRRTGRLIPSLTAYSLWAGIREEEENNYHNWPRNLIRNLKLGKFSWKYPREALFRELPVLLGLTNNPCSGWEEETSNFLKTWKKFN